MRIIYACARVRTHTRESYLDNIETIFIKNSAPSISRFPHCDAGLMAVERAENHNNGVLKNNFHGYSFMVRSKFSHSDAGLSRRKVFLYIIK